MTCFVKAEIKYITCKQFITKIKLYEAGTLPQ